MPATLEAAFAELQSDVGHYLGYGRTSGSWSTAQADNVAMVLRSGLRQFYHCGYDWSFLKPVAALTLTQGESSVPLPPDYAAADGPAAVGVASSGSAYRPLPFGPWQPVYQWRVRQPDTTGPPQYLCEGPTKGTGAGLGQRMRLDVWPTADQDYTLTFAYRLNPLALDGTLPYAYGGAQHAQTLLQSCKAAAERDLDGIREDQGPQQVTFKRMLEESQVLDRRSKPHTVGYNRDRSDARRRGWNTAPRQLPPIVVQGTIYD